MSQWYYGDAQGNRHGPMSASQLAAVHAQGLLQPETLVWREGLEGWKPWRELMHEVVAAPPPPPTPPASPEAAAAGVAAAAAAPTRSVFDAAPVVDTGYVVYAGFWKRVAASIIDSFILMMASWLVQVPLFMVMGLGMGSLFEGSSGLSDGMGTLLVAIGYLISLAVPLFYFAWMHSSSMQASIGKLAIGIKVVDGQGRRIGFWRGFARYFAYLLSALLFCIGFLMAAFTDRKRALHDILCDTLVVDRYAYSERPDLQNPAIGAVAIIVLVLAGLLLVTAIAGVIFLIAALGSGGWH